MIQSEDEKVELEEQFILRLPVKWSRKIREILRTKPKKIKKLMKIELDIPKHSGNVYIGKTVLKGSLKNLPTIVESYKTLDKVKLYKTADVSQILICEDVVSQSDKWIHGIAPALKNIKKSRFRKTLVNQNQAMEIENIERELLYLLRADMEAISTKFEILYDEDKQDRDNKEIILFGNLSSDSDDN